MTEQKAIPSSTLPPPSPISPVHENVNTNTTVASGENLNRNPRFSNDFLRAVPKTDLHVHLDGSVRLETLIELAQQNGVCLPYNTVSELREHIFKPSYSSLEEYLEPFKWTVACLQTAGALERISYEFAQDCLDEGVVYFEPRFAPQLHAGPDLSLTEVLHAVNRGLSRACKEYNSAIDAKNTEDDDKKNPQKSMPKPHCNYGIIVAALRFFNKDMSHWYNLFCKQHEHEDRSRVYGLASMALVATCVRAKRDDGIPIVALDIAGAEAGFPAAQHKEAFDYAHKSFLNKTVHAGEGWGADSIFQAITDLHAERIGHGTNIFKSCDKIDVSALVQYVAEHRVTLEVCLKSNLDTMPHLEGDASKHPFGKMLTKRFSLVIATDNRLVSNTTIVNELRLAADTFDLTAKQMKDIVITGFKRSFYPGIYTEKRAFVRRIIDYYERLEAQHNVCALEEAHEKNSSNQVPKRKRLRSDAAYISN